MRREEAILDLQVQGPDLPRLFLDVTVRHGVPGCAGRLRRAAVRGGAVNAEAEEDTKDRYPSNRVAWRALPLAIETYGRVGTLALRHLRRLARVQSERIGDDAGIASHHLLQRWGCRISVALQRANALNVRRAIGSAASAGRLRAQLLEDLAV